jgi:hypothetical protein
MPELLGPVLFVLDSSPENQIWGVLFCLVLATGFLVGFIRPRVWSIRISLIAAMAWVLLGILGHGMHC